MKGYDEGGGVDFSTPMSWPEYCTTSGHRRIRGRIGAALPDRGSAAMTTVATFLNWTSLIAMRRPIGQLAPWPGSGPQCRRLGIVGRTSRNRPAVLLWKIPFQSYRLHH